MNDGISNIEIVVEPPVEVGTPTIDLDEQAQQIALRILDRPSSVSGEVTTLALAYTRQGIAQHAALEQFRALYAYRADSGLEVIRGVRRLLDTWRTSTSASILPPGMFGALLALESMLEALDRGEVLLNAPPAPRLVLNPED
jgi:hypothetical protein